MTTEKYLKRLKWLENMIISRADKIDLGRSRATNMVVPTDRDPVQTSPRDKLSEIMSEVVDTDKELQTYKAEYKAIIAKVETLTGEYSAAYIYLRYAKDRSVNDIARTLHISRSTAYRVQRDALYEFEKKYGETYKQEKKCEMLTHFDTV